MYYQVISQCTQALKNLEAWLDKAEQHAATKKFDVGVLMTGRRAPDMKPLRLPGSKRVRLCQGGGRLAVRADAA